LNLWYQTISISKLYDTLKVSTMPKIKEITHYLTNCIHNDAAWDIKVVIILGIGEWIIKCVE